MFCHFFLSVIKIASTPKQDTDRSVPLRVDWIWNRDVSTLCLNKAPMLSFHMIVNSFNCHTHEQILWMRHWVSLYRHVAWHIFISDLWSYFCIFWKQFSKMGCLTSFPFPQSFQEFSRASEWLWTSEVGPSRKWVFIIIDWTDAFGHGCDYNAATSVNEVCWADQNLCVTVYSFKFVCSFCEKRRGSVNVHSAAAAAVPYFAKLFFVFLSFTAFSSAVAGVESEPWRKP